MVVSEIKMFMLDIGKFEPVLRLKYVIIVSVNDVHFREST